MAKTYDKFNDIDGGSIGAESGDAKIETMSKKLFGFFLTLWWEIGIHTSAAMNSNSPTSHNNFSLF
jgi:hypothetical protein